MEPLIVDKKLVGFKEGNVLGYFHSETPETPFSNFYYLQVPIKIWFCPEEKTISPAPFVAKSATPHMGLFVSIEQLFAFGKAFTMNDKQSMTKIYGLHTNNSLEYKKLGREVINFEESKWNQVSSKWMECGMLAKFQQDSFCKKALLATNSMQLAEANPYDRVWGTGKQLETGFSSYTGQNLQGNLLMQVRDIILKGEK